MTAPPVSGLDVSGPLPGQLVFPDEGEFVMVGLAAATKINVGQAVTFDASGNAILATDNSSIQDGIGVCTIGGDNTAGIAQAVYIQVAVGNTYIYYTAAGAIKNFAQIIISSVTGNGAQAQAGANTNAGTVFIYVTTTFARYFYHQGETFKPTAAISGDIIAIRLGFD